MGWFKSNSNVYTDINAVVAGGAIAVTLVAAAAEAVVAAAVYLLLKESDEVKLRPLDMLRNETFKSCVRIANKLGGVDFSNEILDVFTSLENGEKVVL
ncbi:hypothetical protein [Enterococcus columbae]|uniref:Uncharacterized protein n=1 Tax=Enterococcus columbae DSM 7374 = ATCC 51263 TaxID=1121865 RepID=S1NPA3_9ENTE|nr:hypothetical protein [Enterococcus columbae]EOT44556.1 hypothetical protein OMW_00612 [Enterococcus columbae DSM 7374 = ATCC 51263]EOW87548.1 hypothetical protein I568_00592 [Enterococcus columbae DSM 7374 = ATCC 51263]OJG25205.1 hypothetical protein RR47_GL001993 [Enterococcus columbae DSM 7374 = ATCC 51263]